MCTAPQPTLPEIGRVYVYCASAYPTWNWTSICLLRLSLPYLRLDESLCTAPQPTLPEIGRVYVYCASAYPTWDWTSICVLRLSLPYLRLDESLCTAPQPTLPEIGRVYVYCALAYPSWDWTSICVLRLSLPYLRLDEYMCTAPLWVPPAPRKGELTSSSSSPSCNIVFKLDGTSEYNAHAWSENLICVRHFFSRAAVNNIFCFT